MKQINIHTDPSIHPSIHPSIRFVKVSMLKWRGTVVEWSETFGHGAESRRKVLRWRKKFAIRQLEHSVNPVNWYPFRIREGLVSERRGMGSDFHHLHPRYSRPLTPLPLRLSGYGKTLLLPFVCFSSTLQVNVSCAL